MDSVSANDFEELVADSLDSLNPKLLELLDNVIFVVEDAPADGSATLGWYDGVSLTERGDYGFGEQPDQIVLFRMNLLAICETIEELKEEIRVTLIHEIAHYCGISEERIHELGWG